MIERLTKPPKLPPRPADGHKGTFGTVIVVGGTTTMLGAPALCAGAALRGGAGLVKIAAPAEIIPYCLTIEPCATGIALPSCHGDLLADESHHAIADTTDEKTVLAIGPGMGIGQAQRELVQRLLIETHQPIVLDADGLNNFAAAPIEAAFREDRALVMTPHPGEFRRLADALGLACDPTHPLKRIEAAEQLAERIRGVVVLKGSRTVVTNARQTYINDSGNPALATAGSGDVLTGLIASLIAQRMTAFEAAAAGVHVHGMTGDAWAQRYGPRGLTARKLLLLLPQGMQRHEIWSDDIPF